jgi:hypothetical protein
VDDEPSLRQRYVLGTLWFLQPTSPTTTGFGSTDHDFATTWTTKMDECEWLWVECDDNGRVTFLNLGDDNVRGQIPHDLGLLTDLTILQLGGNQLSGTIPSSLGALTALSSLYLNNNQLVGTIPSSLSALRALSRLWLFNNQLVGTMPICNSNQSFQYLVADCAKVNCTCCTNCCPAAFGNIPKHWTCVK